VTLCATVTWLESRREVRLLHEVTLREIERIFAITDAMGIHREQLVIPLLPRHPGRLRRMPGGKLEIVVDSEADFDAWLEGLEAAIRQAAPDHS
jgi:hypothetical protein